MIQEQQIKTEKTLFADRTNIPEAMAQPEAKVKLEKKTYPYYKSQKLGSLVSYFLNQNDEKNENPVKVVQNREDLYMENSKMRYMTIEEKVKNRLSGESKINSDFDILSLSTDQLMNELSLRGVEFKPGAPKNRLINLLQRSLMN